MSQNHKTTDCIGRRWGAACAPGGAGPSLGGERSERGIGRAWILYIILSYGGLSYIAEIVS